MQTHSHNTWWLRIVTFSLAALAAASATYWGLLWLATVPARPTAPVIFTGPGAPDPHAVARLLGGGQTGAAATPAVATDSAASRFKLTGVVANQRKRGYALIAIDGQPAKPYRVGAAVTDTLVLQSVAPRSAALAASLDAPVSLTLALPRVDQGDARP